MSYILTLPILIFFYVRALKLCISVTCIICDLCLNFYDEGYCIPHLLQTELLQFKQSKGCLDDVLICDLCLNFYNEGYCIPHLLQTELLQFKQSEGCLDDVFRDVGGVTEMDLV